MTLPRGAMGLSAVCDYGISRSYSLIIFDRRQNSWLAMFTPKSIVSTPTVTVSTLSVNEMKMMVGNVYTMFYSIDTNGCSSNA